MNRKAWTVAAAILAVTATPMGAHGATADAGAAKPAAVAKAIGKAYRDAMTRTAALVKDRPDARTVAPKLAALREAAIQTIVGHGKTIAAMNDADKGQMETRVFRELRSLDAATFQAVTDAASHYRSTDSDLANLIARMNTLTQYAFFDLLRKQDPKEAKRLGI